jgi:hypothetical protein
MMIPATMMKTMRAFILAGTLFCHMTEHTQSAGLGWNYSIGTPEQLELFRSSAKWLLCHPDDPPPVPMDALVPKDTFFLTADITDLDDAPPICPQSKYNLTIPTGMQTIFWSILSLRWWDSFDDWETGDPGCTPANTSQGQMEFVLDNTNQDVEHFLAESTKDSMYAMIDGQEIEVSFLFDSYELLADSCPNGKMCKDTCDAIATSDCSGVEAYPNYGYYAMDTREWKNGETHVFEYGGAVQLGNQLENFTDFIGANITGMCRNVEYTITAYDATPPSDTSPPPPSSAVSFGPKWLVVALSTVLIPLSVIFNGKDGLMW